MKKLLFGFGFSLLTISGIFAQAPNNEGPADESAYWVLKLNGGQLNPIPVIIPHSINFGQLEVGKVKRETVKVLNKGYGDLVIKKVYLKNGVEFGIKKTTCTKPLDYGQGCEITVEFKPDAPGNYTDTLYIATNDRKNPIYQVKLSGEAIGAIIEVSENLKPTTAPVPAPPPLPVETQQKEKQKPSQPKKEKVKKTQPKKVEKTNKKNEKRKEKKVVYTYWTVKPCDTLWDISAKVYGTPLLWAAIYEANKNQISDPWIIEVGTKLKVPKLTPAEREKYKKESLKLMEEMADRPLGPKCPF